MEKIVTDEEPRPFVSAWDEAIAEQTKRIETLRRVPKLDEEAERTLLEAFKVAQLLLTARAQDDVFQEKMRRAFLDPGYNVDQWRRIAWVDYGAEQKREAGDVALHLRHRQRGLIDITSDEVAYDQRAGQSREAIEAGVLHAKAAWKGHAIEVDGASPFKATAWAYAQIHGVEVKNYRPEGEELKLAQQIIAERADEPKQHQGKTNQQDSPPSRDPNGFTEIFENLFKKNKGSPIPA